jgi:hypothetical protein
MYRLDICVYGKCVTTKINRLMQDFIIVHQINIFSTIAGIYEISPIYTLINLL